MTLRLLRLRRERFAVAKGGLRIRHEGMVAGLGKTRLFFVDDDGNETEISDYVRDFEASFVPGEPVAVKITMLLKDWDMDVPLDAVKVARHFHDVSSMTSVNREFAAA